MNHAASCESPAPRATTPPLADADFQGGVIEPDPFAAENDWAETLQCICASLAIRKVVFKRSWTDLVHECMSMTMLLRGERHVPSTRAQIESVVRAHSSFEGARRTFSHKLVCSVCGRIGQPHQRFAKFSCDSCKLKTPHCMRVFRTSLREWASELIARHGERLQRRASLGTRHRLANRICGYLDGEVASSSRSGDGSVMIDLVLYCDGFSVDKYQRSSVTVFYGKCYNLPPHARESKLLACLDGSTPQDNYDVVMGEWVGEIELLYREGLTVGGVTYRVRLHALLGDAPALRKLTAFRGGSYLNANFCTICTAHREQERIPAPDNEPVGDDPESDVGDVSVDEDDDSSEDEEPEERRNRAVGPRFIGVAQSRSAAEIRRNADQYLLLAGKEREIHSRACGHRHTQLYTLQHFDCVRQSPNDTMHTLFLGIARDVVQFLDDKFWCRQRVKMRDRLAEVTEELPRQLTRCGLPSESRRTAAYYLSLMTNYLPVLLEHLPEEFHPPLQALRNVFVVVSDVAPHRNEVSSLRQRTEAFVESWTRASGESVVRKLNFHSCLHIADAIENLGCGPEFWCFEMERKHQGYKGMKTNNINLPTQIAALDELLARSVEIAERLGTSTDNPVIREFVRDTLDLVGGAESTALSDSEYRSDADVDGSCASLFRNVDEPELHVVSSAVIDHPESIQ